MPIAHLITNLIMGYLDKHLFGGNDDDEEDDNDGKETTTDSTTSGD